MATNIKATVEVCNILAPIEINILNYPLFLFAVLLYSISHSLGYRHYAIFKYLL